MKLEPTIQSEIGQKGKHQYSVLMHIYGIYSSIKLILKKEQKSTNNKC